MKVSGWGRYPSVDTQLCFPRDVETLSALMSSKHSVIARGNGRAYGDSAVNPFSTVSMKYFDRMLSFETKTGQLVAESGTLLSDIIKTFLPRGWFPMVTPGTKFVTLGGMIAADVHGKNHHKEGSFRTCVDWIDVLGINGEIIRCSQETNIDLYEHTLGGMGLTASFYVQRYVSDRLKLPGYDRQPFPLRIFRRQWKYSRNTKNPLTQSPGSIALGRERTWGAL